MKNQFFKYFLVVIILLTMYNNLEHSASLYYELTGINSHSENYNRFHSYLVVIVIDLAVMAFILTAKITESKIFAWLLFIVNLLFYDTTTAVYRLFTSISPIDTINCINRITAVIVFSGIFSYSLHRFSLLYYSIVGAQGSVDELKALLRQSEEWAEQKEEELKDAKADLQQCRESAKENEVYTNHLKAELKQAQLYKNALTCEHCNEYAATSIKGYNAHAGVCKQKQNKAE